MFLLSVWLYSRFGPHDDFASIDYDEFVKEFLLKGRVKEITMTEKGTIFVEILNGENRCDFRHS